MASPQETAKPLSSGVALADQVKAFAWTWFYLPLTEEVNGTTILHNAMVSVDSDSLVQIAGEDTWATLDVLLLNSTMIDAAQTGDPGTLPADAAVWAAPDCWIDGNCPEGYGLLYKERMRVTASFGFNQTAPGGMMPPLSQLIIGVRDSGGSGGTGFTIRATQLPRVLHDGMVIQSAVAPCTGTDEPMCRQYFTVPVHGYDILSLKFERAGDNLTFVGEDGVTYSNGGRGFAGTFYVGGPATYHLPPPIASEAAHVLNNVSSGAEVDYFCTLDPQSGTYTVAVVAATGGGGGFGPELLTTPAEIAIGLGVSRGQGRGDYILRVRHAQFQDGAMSPSGEVRPGCVTYGQTRNFTVQTSGLSDANLYAEVSGANVSALRARCTGCDWVSANPPISALAASPCTMRNETIWEVQVSLADETSATLAGLKPVEFSLSTALQNATLGSGDRVTPRAEGGRGYLCCGAVQSYVVPDVPQSHALSVELNLTSGHVRAAFLKHGACANPRLDVNGAECTGVCQMSWLTVYDEFYGSMEFTSQSSVTVPFGPRAWEYNALTTKRRAGDWYISIQALPGHTAEYQLGVKLLAPPRAPKVFACSRFLGFCPQDHYHAGLTTVTASVVATSGASALSMPWLSAVCTLLAFLVNAFSPLSRRATRRVAL